MATWVVGLTVNLTGLGERTISREMDADTADEAIDRARTELVMVAVTSVTLKQNSVPPTPRPL